MVEKTSVSTTAQAQDFLHQGVETMRADRPDFASRDRVNRFLKALDLIEANREILNHQVMQETRKHPSLVDAELDSALSFARQVAHSAFASAGNVIKSATEFKYVSVDRVPLGCAILITSYNTPMPNLFWKLAPSYLAGNLSLVCPSPYVAKSALMVIQILYEAGIDKSDVAITNGDSALAEFATKSSMVNLISFTGSNEVGRVISINAAPNHPKLILELGGTNPSIITDTARTDEACRAVLLSAFSNGGQRCAAGSVAVVYQSIYETFLAEMLSMTRDSDFQTSLRILNTPPISEGSASAHKAFLSKEESKGATVIQLADLATDLGSVPAIVCDSPRPVETCSEEIFSPVIRLVTVEGREEAIRFANKLPLRLTSAVWTSDISELNHFKNHLDFGLINFNGPTFGAEPNFPFGGMGRSGNGSRDAGFNALESYSQTRIWTMVS